MEEKQLKRPILPPDKGKDWLDKSLPLSDNEMNDDFKGFSGDEMEMRYDTQRSRKRRDKIAEINDTTNKQLKKQKQSQLSKSTTLKQTLTNSKITPSKIKIHTTGKTNDNNIHTQNHTEQQIWVKNDQHNVIFIEPLSIKEGEKLLEPMEVGKFLHEMKLDQFSELKRAGQYRYKLTFKTPKDTEPILNATSTLKNNNYKAFIPKMLLETTGIIKNVPTSITEHEIYQNAIADKNNHPGRKNQKTKRSERPELGINRY